MVLHVIGGPRTFLGQICVKYIACWIQNYVLKNPQWNLLLEKNSCHSKKCILISPYTAWMFISRAFWTQNTIVHTWTGCRWTEAKPEFTQSKSRLCTVKPSSILLAVQSPTRFPIMLLELLWLFFYTLWQVGCTAGHVCPCFALLPEGDMICFPTLRIWASLMACLGLWNAANMVVFWS
jgi:hypothetical protein